MAKYHEIATEIKENILAGVYKPEQLLPSQEELTEKYDTSRITVQKAIDVLKNEGLVKSRRGYGTYVVSHIPLFDRKLESYTGISKQLKGKGNLETKVLHFEIRFASTDEQEKLKLGEFDPVYQISRLRTFDEEPLLLEYTIMPVHLIPGVNDKILRASIYQYIENDLELEIGIAERRIRADKSTDYDQKFLNCTISDPILEVEQVAYLENGLPFELSNTRYRYDKGDIITVGKNRNKEIS